MAVPGIKEEELALIKSALLLGFLQKVFERDARILEQSGLLKSPEAYVDLIRGGERRVALVLSEIQVKFRERNIEIERIRQDENGIQADYRCRGYHGKMRILWAGLQREVSTRMRAYLGSGGASAKERLSSETASREAATSPPLQAAAKKGPFKRALQKPRF